MDIIQQLYKSRYCNASWLPLESKIRLFLVASLLSTILPVSAAVGEEESLGSLPINPAPEATKINHLISSPSHSQHKPHLASLMLNDAQQWAEKGWLEEARALATRAAQLDLEWQPGELTPNELLAQLDRMKNPIVSHTSQNDERGDKPSPVPSQVENESILSKPAANHRLFLAESRNQEILPSESISCSPSKEIFFEPHRLMSYSPPSIPSGKANTAQQNAGPTNSEESIHGVIHINRDAPTAAERDIDFQETRQPSRKISAPLPIRTPLRRIKPIQNQSSSLGSTPSLNLAAIGVAIAVGSFIAGSIFGLVGIVTSTVLLPRWLVKTGVSNLTAQQFHTATEDLELQQASPENTGRERSQVQSKHTCDEQLLHKTLPIKTQLENRSTIQPSSFFTRILQSNLELQTAAAKSSSS